ncbi:hypothetical protein K491DRAFT_240008 [Lophiostoma macrostomum CBS 122681]|uniref:Rhodopsin domain-containing protein n=1 Tax=Lophiostoma macrostomum CBS 122681 TaxID=1314788 RepID=A0A6A6SLL4_9PLEO|nr:hypothetical protein K491DRAFT_240008 [Lophiostoma macrostomum CBS 122681]
MEIMTPIPDLYVRETSAWEKAYPSFETSAHAVNWAKVFLATTLPVYIVATFIIVARVYTRSLPVWRFSIDDYLISIAFILMSVMFALQYASMSWAFHASGPISRSVDERQYSSMLGTISLPFWAWSTGFVKFSIATMLLRFQQSQSWKYVIYTMISLNIVLVLFTGVGNLFQCIPYQSTWDFKNQYPNKKCWGDEMNAISMYVASFCNIASDVVFSLMPLTFLAKIRRPMKEKIVIGVLMGLGLIASTFSALKAGLTKRLADGHDTTANVILIGMLSNLEVQTALIAACIPTLRSSWRGLMIKLGLKKSDVDSRYPQYDEGSSLCDGRKGRKTGVREMDRVDSATANDSQRGRKSIGLEQLDDDDEALYEMDPVTGRIVCTSPRKTALERSVEASSGAGALPPTSPTGNNHTGEEAEDTPPVNPQSAHTPLPHTRDAEPISPLSDSSFDSSDNGRWSRYWGRDVGEEESVMGQAIGVAK